MPTGGRSPRLFESFDEAPLAAASIAQVHAAVLKDGRQVVVKVLRPGVRADIERDLEVMHVLARFARDYYAEGRRLRPTEVVREYEKTILDELDLMREAANASQLRRNFQDSDLLYVPEVHWDLCRGDVMVMERIHGVLISEARRSSGAWARTSSGWPRTACRSSSRRCSATTSSTPTCIPGTSSCGVEDPEHPRYAAVDFGIVGTLDSRDQHYLAENFLAFFDRDYNRVARLHVDSGWVPAGTRVDELESAVRTVCEPIFQKPLSEISFAQVLLRLFETARRFQMEVQPQLILLQKTLLQIEGLGRQLYPELDLWKTAQPILREWAAERMSGRSFAQELRRQLPDLGEAIRSLPQALQALAQHASDGRFVVRVEQTGIRELRAELRAGSRRRDGTVIGATLLLGGLVWLAVGASLLPGLVLAGAGGLTIVFARRGG